MDHSASRIAHRDHRGIPITEQVDARSPDADRLVDLQEMIRFLTVGQFSDLGFEPARLPELVASHLTIEGRLETVQSQPEVLHPIGIEESAGLERVIGHQRVGERVTFDEYSLTRILKQRPDSHRDDQTQQGGMKHQVPGLAEVAALGGDMIVVSPGAVAPLLQPLLGFREQCQAPSFVEGFLSGN